jgi:hypothetical protein
MTASRAVWVGHLRVTLPLLVVIVSCVLAGRSLGAGRLGGLVGVALGWLVWASQVPRWRDWVQDQGLEPQQVQPLAVRTGLIWPTGSLPERTEFRRRDGRRGW